MVVEDERSEGDMGMIMIMIIDHDHRDDRRCDSEGVDSRHWLELAAGDRVDRVFRCSVSMYS